ncbi:MAG: hypothetical protein MUF21_08575 [Gemmatimonadaceae bacterium]|nr:hypothetical protein [Gemmatimonadaceae bacterium]
MSRIAASLLGDDAVLVRVRVSHVEDGTEVEVVAAAASDVEAFRTRITPAPLPARDTFLVGRPWVIALVGPTGAGKTTTIAKLAASALAFGGWRTGLLTLDTYRVAGLEQLATYAELTGCALEVAYDADDAREALARLDDCDVVLVDTPGRSPRAGARDDEWQDALAALAPDETHLVLPAGLRLDVALAARHAHASLAPTHALLTKLDEVPGDAGVADLADALDLPTRWLADGTEVPTALAAAPSRLLAALGLAPALVIA